MLVSRPFKDRFHNWLHQLPFELDSALVLAPGKPGLKYHKNIFEKTRFVFIDMRYQEQRNYGLNQISFEKYLTSKFYCKIIWI